MRRDSSGGMIVARAAGAARGMGAIKPISGNWFADFMGQWHAMGLPAREWGPCGKQHIIGDDEASQAMPQARGAIGIASRATITKVACVRRIEGRLSQQRV